VKERDQPNPSMDQFHVWIFSQQNEQTLKGKRFFFCFFARPDQSNVHVQACGYHWAPKSWFVYVSVLAYNFLFHTPVGLLMCTANDLNQFGGIDGLSFASLLLMLLLVMIEIIE
jgi:hypothetical protein